MRNMWGSEATSTSNSILGRNLERFEALVANIVVAMICHADVGS